MDAFPIPQREIEVHAANMHIIPANDTVKRQLSKIRTGQLVHIKGQLIEAKRPMAGIGVARSAVKIPAMALVS